MSPLLTVILGVVLLVALVFLITAFARVTTSLRRVNAQATEAAEAVRRLRQQAEEDGRSP